MLNRYVRQGILADAAAGRHVVYVAGDAHGAAAAFRDLLAGVDLTDVEVAATAGRQRADWDSGGRIVTATAAALPEAWPAGDIYYIPQEGRSQPRQDALLADLYRALTARGRIAEVIT